MLHGPHVRNAVYNLTDRHSAAALIKGRAIQRYFAWRLAKKGRSAGDQSGFAHRRLMNTIVRRMLVVGLWLLSDLIVRFRLSPLRPDADIVARSAFMIAGDNEPPPGWRNW
jgi:hypothetical protein